ncbi:MAG: adenylate kinase family protein [Phycisphaerales bacterium]|jgi:adenylate kinase|nr:nucleoside monophosphate kinase [Phycisphaeraceae bacterium]
MTKRYRTVLLFGAPGAGKGTQGKILGQIPGFYHLSCGEVFRNLDTSSTLGRIFMDYSSKGLLVPDEPTIQMWSQNMHARTTLGIYKPNVDLLVLDGIPRNLHQAKLLDTHLKVLKIIHLICPDKERMIERLRRRALKENRVDDAKEDVIRKRWQVYERETYPVLEHYSKDMIAEVDAMGSPAAVLAKVLEELVPVQNAHYANALSGDEPAAAADAPAKVAPRRASANGTSHAEKSSGRKARR